MAKSVALARYRRKEERKAASASRARAAAKAQVQQNTCSMITAGTGFGIGLAEKQAIQLPTIDGIEPTALYTMAALVGSFFIKDKQISRLLRSATNGLAAITLYKAGRGGFEKLFKYEYSQIKPATAGWGEEIVETGEF